MRYSVLFLALLSSTLIECKAEGLALFGLGDVEVISERESDKVRGLGMFSRSTVANGISVNIIASGFGANFNLFTTDHQHTNDTKPTSDVTVQPTDLGTAAQSIGIAEITDFGLLLTNDSNGFIRSFNLQMSGFTSQSSGQGLSGLNAPVSFQQ